MLQMQRRLSVHDKEIQIKEISLHNFQYERNVVCFSFLFFRS